MSGSARWLQLLHHAMIRTCAASAWPRVSGSDSPLPWPVAIFRSMPLLDLAPEEYAEVVRLVRNAIDGDRFPLSARTKRLKSILEKLDPASVQPAVTPYPAPKPAGEPSL